MINTSYECEWSSSHVHVSWRLLKVHRGTIVHVLRWAHNSEMDVRYHTKTCPCVMESGNVCAAWHDIHASLLTWCSRVSETKQGKVRTLRTLSAVLSLAMLIQWTHCQCVCEQCSGCCQTCLPREANWCARQNTVLPRAVCSTESVPRPNTVLLRAVCSTRECATTEHSATQSSAQHMRVC